VKEHIKIHTSISEVEDLRNQVKSLKTQVEELEAKLKSSQSKLAFQTRKIKKFKKKKKMESEQEILGHLASSHISTLEGSRKKRKVPKEEAVYETTVPVHEEKKQKNY
jgi:septal ring factor EnvC (AmiA/AmiB activator)